MKLTGTNSPIGLIVLIDHAHHPATNRLSGLDELVQRSRMSGSWKRAYAPRGRRTTGDGLPSCMGAKSTRQDTIRPIDVFTKTKEIKNLYQLLENTDMLSRWIALSRPGGYCGVAAPVPIPNTAVKRPCANGTPS